MSEHPDELMQKYVEAMDQEPGWHPSDWAWITMAAGIVAYEIACPPGELLSDATTRYGQSHMFLSSAVIGVVAVHLLRTTGLLRFIPGQLDLIHLLASLK